MCRIYHPVGSLTAVKSHLRQHHITAFQSLNEVIAFQKEYASSRQRIIANSALAIEQEKNLIALNNLQLGNSIESTKKAVEKRISEQIKYLRSRVKVLASSDPSTTWQKFARYLTGIFLKTKIRIFERSLPVRVRISVRKMVRTFQKNENRYHYIHSNLQRAVIENCSKDLQNIDRKKFIIDEIQPFIYGAIGEHKVVKELETLPDSFVLINDFCMSFNPPIYWRNRNEYIKTIQVDHILIGPSGVFLIETKNWSEQSLNNPKLRSPVSQVERSSFALFTILNKKTSGFSLNTHHWGKKNIPLKSLVVIINRKPRENFQYVKILTLSELLGYIKYFPPTLTSKETDQIANKLIRLSGKGATDYYAHKLDSRSNQAFVLRKGNNKIHY